MSTCRGVMSTSQMSLENVNRHVDISLLKWDVDISVKTAIPYINFLNVLHTRFIFRISLAKNRSDAPRLKQILKCALLLSPPRNFWWQNVCFRDFGRFDLTPNFVSWAWEWWHLATSRSYEMSTCDISLGRLKSTCRHLRCRHLARCLTSQMSGQALKI